MVISPDAFYGVEDTDLHNVDVMTDVSMAPTAFTRYTQAPSTASKASTKYVLSLLGVRVIANTLVPGGAPVLRESSSVK